MSETVKAIQGDTCTVCGYVYDEGEEIHYHRREGRNRTKRSGSLCVLLFVLVAVVMSFSGCVSVKHHRIAVKLAEVNGKLEESTKNWKVIRDVMRDCRAVRADGFDLQAFEKDLDETLKRGREDFGGMGELIDETVRRVERELCREACK